jgi:hypothetical protein
LTKPSRKKCRSSLTFAARLSGPERVETNERRRVESPTRNAGAEQMHLSKYAFVFTAHTTFMSSAALAVTKQLVVETTANATFLSESIEGHLSDRPMKYFVIQIVNALRKLNPGLKSSNASISAALTGVETWLLIAKLSADPNLIKNSSNKIQAEFLERTKLATKCTAIFIQRMKRDSKFVVEDPFIEDFVDERNLAVAVNKIEMAVAEAGVAISSICESAYMPPLSAEAKALIR